MSWAKIDDQFYNHPKVAALGPYLLPCVGLHVLALCYAGAYLTNGRVPRTQIPRLAGDLTTLLQDGDPFVLVDRLIAVRLWHDRGAFFVIHDYLKYNPSRKQVLEARRNKVLAGQAGGQASAQARAQAGRQAERKQNSTPVPVPVLKEHPETTGALSVPSPNGQADERISLAQYLAGRIGRPV